MRSQSAMQLTAWIWLFGWIALAALHPGTSPVHDLPQALLSPSWQHPFGFDAFGRDLLGAVLRASLLSASFALFSTAIASFAALIGGASLALAPTAVRFVCLRALETLLAFPSLLLALGWAAIRGPGWDTLTFSLVLGILPGFTRFVYVRTRELLVEEYILAARALGGTTWRLLWNHLRPALFSFLRVKAPGLFAYSLLAESTLSFLGIGAPIGKDTWGSLLAQGREYLFERPHIAIGSGFPLVVTVLLLQLLSERHGGADQK